MRRFGRFVGVSVVMTAAIVFLAGTPLWSDRSHAKQYLTTLAAGGLGALAVIFHERAHRARGLLRLVASLPVMLLTVGAGMTIGYGLADSVGGRALAAGCGGFVGGLACALLDGDGPAVRTDPSVFD